MSTGDDELLTQVSASLKRIEDSVREQNEKTNHIEKGQEQLSKDLQQLRSDLRDMGTRNEAFTELASKTYADRDAVLRLEGRVTGLEELQKVRVSGLEERQKIRLEALQELSSTKIGAQGSATKATDARLWWLIGILFTTAVGLAVAYLSSGGP